MNVPEKIILAGEVLRAPEEDRDGWKVTIKERSQVTAPEPRLFSIYDMTIYKVPAEVANNLARGTTYSFPLAKNGVKQGKNPEEAEIHHFHWKWDGSADLVPTPLEKMPEATAPAREQAYARSVDDRALFIEQGLASRHHDTVASGLIGHAKDLVIAFLVTVPPPGKLAKLWQEAIESGDPVLYIAEGWYRESAAWARPAMVPTNTQPAPSPTPPTPAALPPPPPPPPAPPTAKPLSDEVKAVLAKYAAEFRYTETSADIIYKARHGASLQDADAVSLDQALQDYSEGKLQL